MPEFECSTNQSMFGLTLNGGVWKIDGIDTEDKDIAKNLSNIKVSKGTNNWTVEIKTSRIHCQYPRQI